MSLDPDEALFVAAGVAGYALAIELLTALAEKKIIEHQTFMDVFDRALVSVENLTPQLPVCRLARFLLWARIADDEPTEAETAAD